MQIITKKVVFVTMCVTGSTGKTEDRSQHNKTTLFMHKIEYFTCNQRLILLFQTDTDISGSRFKFDRGKALLSMNLSMLKLVSECFPANSIKRLVKIKLTRSFKSVREYDVNTAKTF